MSEVGFVVSQILSYRVIKGALFIVVSLRGEYGVFHHRPVV